FAWKFSRNNGRSSWHKAPVANAPDWPILRAAKITIVARLHYEFPPASFPATQSPGEEDGGPGEGHRRRQRKWPKARWPLRARRGSTIRRLPGPHGRFRARWPFPWMFRAAANAV